MSDVQPAQHGIATLTGRWTLVPQESRARFHVRDKLLATAHGQLPLVEGGVDVADGGAVTRAWIVASTADLDTGNARRDGHLRAPRFLDTRRHPTLRVTASSVLLDGDDATASATLLALGVPLPLDLIVRITGREPGPAADAIRLRVSGRLDRRPLGWSVPTAVIGRYVDVEADLVFRRPIGASDD